MLDWFEANNEFVLVLERQTNMMDLFDYNSRLGPLPEASARIVYQQLAEAILHCHDRGVVHRDLKEENVLINKETFQVKLIDFGCGCHLQVGRFSLAGLDFWIECGMWRHTRICDVIKFLCVCVLLRYAICIMCRPTLFRAQRFECIHFLTNITPKCDVTTDRDI